MRLATIVPPDSDRERAAAVLGDVVSCYPEGVGVVDLIAAAGPVADPNGREYPLADVRLLAPIPRPRVLFGVGLNYAAHAAEQGRDLPQQPIIFTMQPGAAAAPGGDVVCPAVVRRLDYEGELAIIIGGGGSIAGYCVADDVSARDLQRREMQWVSTAPCRSGRG